MTFENLYVKSDNDEYLTRVVIDTCARTFYMYSNEGEARSIRCDSIDEFMTVLELIRKVVDDNIIAYSDVVTKK
tara:strand:+ start:102 stop:323 length:222 start_codon:yes stop_codon:yes gene_type:complete